MTNNLTFKDMLNSYETYGAFNKFKSVKEVKETEELPSSYHAIFKDNCECGSEMIVNDTLTSIRCCNPRCPIKLGHMLAEMFSRFDVKGLGPATCISTMKAAMKDLEYKSIFEIFSMDEYELPLAIKNYKYAEYLTAIEVITSKKYSFPEFVSKLGLPGMDKTSFKIFEDCSNVTELSNKIDEIGGIQQYLESKDIYAPMTAFYLREHIKDICLAEAAFGETIRATAMQTIKICVTGGVNVDGYSVTREQFISKLNDAGTLPNGACLYSFIVSDAFKSVPYIVADFPSNTKKYREAVNRNVLITAQGLIDEVRRLVKEVEDTHG